MTRYLPILLLAAAPSPAPVIEEPDLIAEMREDAQDGRTTNKTVLDYIDSLRAALVEAEEKARECYAFADVQRETAEQAAKEAIFFKHRAEQAESALAAAKAGAAPHQNADQPKAAPQAPCTPRRSSPGLAERPDSPNGVSLERAAILDETDSGVKPAGAAPRVGETTTPRTDAFSNVIAAQGTAKPAWYEFARQLERESSELKAQLEGFRKDAERYRWLRSNIGMYYGGDQRDGQRWKLDDLDAAIDSAQEKAE
jgi:hypothetical protein